MSPTRKHSPRTVHSVRNVTDVVVDEIPMRELKRTTDIAIITMKTEEMAAVLDQFGALDKPPCMARGARNYSVIRVPLASAREDGRTFTTVAITRCPTQGNTTTQDVARDIIREVAPNWILLVGIAGGVPASEFGIGDVVLSTTVLDFTVEAVKRGEEREFAVEGRQLHYEVENYSTTVGAHQKALGNWFKLTIHSGGKRRPLRFPPLPLKDKRFDADANWRKDARDCLRRHLKREPRVPQVVGVTIGASDRLIKDPELVKVWLRVARHVRAVEMESAGLHIAARGRGRGRRAVPAMSVRGISDIVGYKRDDRWTLFACHSAAAFAYAFVRSGHVHPKATETGARVSKTAAPKGRIRDAPASIEPINETELLSSIDAKLRRHAGSFASLFAAACAADESARRLAEDADRVELKVRSELSTSRIRDPKLKKSGRVVVTVPPTGRGAKTSSGIQGGAELWSSGSEYFGEMRSMKPSGVGVFKIPTREHGSSNVFRGEVREGGFGHRGVYRFANSNEFSGTWVDRRPQLGVFRCEAYANTRGYTLFIGEMDEFTTVVSPATRTHEESVRRRWSPNGRGVALRADGKSLLVGTFSDSFPTSFEEIALVEPD